MFLAFANYSEAQISIEGQYLGSNLYVQNPWDQYEDYCIDSVLVNGVKYSDSQEFTAFQIKLDSLGFSLNDPLEINIYHKRGCKPKILNQNHHYQKFDLKIKHTKFENDTVSWIANELVSGRFEVQVYRWNKWVTLDTIQKLIKDSSFHSDLSTDLHSGENRLRVRFVNNRNESLYSDELIHESNLEEVTYSIDKKSNSIYFSAVTRYEFYDEYGLKILTGKGDFVDLDRLPNKLYYLNLDNRNIEIKLKH